MCSQAQRSVAFLEFEAAIWRQLLSGNLAMLFDDKLLFIHTPKCAGMSVTRFLIDSASQGMTLTAPAGHAQSEYNVKVIEGRRHETLAQAKMLLSSLNRSLEDFQLIISIIRNPYDLEVSYYHYKRLGYPWDAGKAQDLAMAGDFIRFAKRAPFYGRLPARIEEWFEIDGGTPPNMRIVRYENLESELYDLIGELYGKKRKLPRLNATKHGSYREYLSRRAERAIYRKYQWIFDSGYYAREPM